MATLLVSSSWTVVVAGPTASGIKRNRHDQVKRVDATPVGIFDVD
jgi:hypothetical protein